MLLGFSLNTHSQNADINLLKSINNNRNISLDNPFKLTSMSVYPISAAVPIGFLSIGLIKKDSAFLHKGINAGIALATDVIITTTLKYIINRKRPYDKYGFIQPVGKENTPSFPSGHSGAAFATATTISLYYPKWYVIIPAYSWAGLVAYSRMHLGVHYPSDVLIGAVVGSLSSYLSYKAYCYVIKK